MLKVTSLLSALLVISLTGFSQNLIISNDLENITYQYLPTPVTIFAKGRKFTDLRVSTDNGTIERGNGYFTLYPAKVGIAKITVKVKENNKLKLIGTSDFIVRILPEPVLKIGSGKDSVRAIEIASQLYARAEIDENNIFICSEWFRYTVDSFTIQIIKDTSVTPPHVNIGNKLDELTKERLKKLNPGDKVLLTNIHATGSDGSKRRAKARVITIL